MHKFRHLREFFKKYSKHYAVGVVFLIIIDIAQLFIPKITQMLTDEYVKGSLNQANLLKYALLIILTGLILMTGRYIWRINIFIPSRRIEYYLRDKIFKKLLTLTPEFYAHNKTGDLMALSTNDVNAVRETFGGGMVMLVDSTFMMAFSLIMMIKTAGLRLSLYVLIILPSIGIFVFIFGKIVHKRFTIVQETFGLLMEKAREHYSGVRVIKGFAKERVFEELFSMSQDENYQANVRLMRIQSLFRPFIIFASGLCLFMVIRYGGEGVIEQEITLGKFLAFQMYLDMLIWPLMAFGMVINFYQRGMASLERISNLLDKPPTIIDPSPHLKDSIEFQSLEFKNLNFTYPDSEREVLKDINFTLNQGKSLAIMGLTGSGKSTIIKLILRLYDAHQGTITYNGYDIKTLPLGKMRESIAVVFQESFLFSETIEESIAFGNEIEIEKIKKVAKIADIEKNIMEFPKQYKTLLEEMGINLSGGQRQRLSLARALYKEPSLLILDDSFSAVDTLTEENILNNLKELKIATIIISHRVSTVEKADEIILLEDGKIIERGNDKTLSAQKGRYNLLKEKQKLEEKIRGE